MTLAFEVYLPQIRLFFRQNYRHTKHWGRTKTAQTKKLKYLKLALSSFCPPYKKGLKVLNRKFKRPLYQKDKIFMSSSWKCLIGRLFFHFIDFLSKVAKKHNICWIGVDTIPIR